MKKLNIIEAEINWNDNNADIDNHNSETVNNTEWKKKNRTTKCCLSHYVSVYLDIAVPNYTHACIGSLFPVIREYENK